MKKAAGKI